MVCCSSSVIFPQQNDCFYTPSSLPLYFALLPGNQIFLNVSSLLMYFLVSRFLKKGQAWICWWKSSNSRILLVDFIMALIHMHIASVTLYNHCWFACCWFTGTDEWRPVLWMLLGYSLVIINYTFVKVETGLFSRHAVVREQGEEWARKGGGETLGVLSEN